MNKILKIFIISCVILLFVGIGLLVAGLVNGGSLAFDIDYVAKKLNTSKNVLLEEKSQRFDEFDSIDVNLNVASIKVIHGDSYSIRYRLLDSENPSIEVVNGTLKIKHDEKKLNFNFNFSEKTDEAYMEITVPDGKSLKNINASSSSGSIYIDGFDASKIVTDVDAGNISVKNSKADSIEVDADYGNAALSDSEITTIRTDVDAGNVDINNVTADSSSIDIDYGNVDIKDSEIKTIKVDNDAGDIKLTGIRVSVLDAETDYGNISAELIGERADYDIEAESDTGNIVICDEKIKDKYKTENGKDKKITVNADTGNINISF